ncbi:Signal transduction histidine kinase [Hahella chejuensis KCTC 2396]|uniref:Sensor protein FixL n=1 Tax=Hahella chejuensis (strain KCTC 2396) TaxID=349521 RepID=Q2SG95_HAHCH|nr:Signal transduction histidine kinase [Hahella chejuensis KCTC 2396]
MSGKLNHKAGGSGFRSESDSRVRAIVEAVADGIITIDNQGVIESFNPAAERIFGYDAEEAVGRNVQMLMPSPFREHHDSYLANYLQTGNAQIIGVGREVLGLRKDGSLFPLDLAVTEMQVEGRRMFTGVVRDISERKASELALQDREARVRAIVDTVVDGIITIDGAGLIDTFNPAAERIFGYAASDVIGVNVSILMPEPYHSEHDGYIAKFMHTGEAKVIGVGREVTGRRRDGSTFPMELAVSEMTVEGRRMFTGVVRDITDRKRMERQKDEFIATVSHELRTPLTAIGGALGLVLGKHGGELPKTVLKMLKVAHRNCDRLTLLINDILEIEKLESGALKFELEDQDLATLIQRSLEDHKEFAGKYQVELRFSNSPPRPWVHVDERRFHQVMSNLISNAVKYSPRGGAVDIAVSDVANRVRVHVKDYGKGIPEDFHSRVFERFSQADSSDTREQGGTGLGLSIAKAIVEHHGGEIGFFSKTNEGAEFYFDLPIRSPEKRPKVSARPCALVCEKDKVLADLLAKAVRAEGLCCEVASDATNALRCLEENQYCLLIIDSALSDDGGFTFMRTLRHVPAAAQLPMLVISDDGYRNGADPRLERGGLAPQAWLSRSHPDLAQFRSIIHQVLLRQERPRILHVEDDPDLVQVARSVLEEIADIQQADALEQARRMLKEQKYDLVILDLELLDGPGDELVDELKPEEIPVIIFSSYPASPQLCAKVQATLVKTMADNAKLRMTVRNLLSARGRARPPDLAATSAPETDPVRNAAAGDASQDAH